jgi:PhoPQ-activated pathogenicity-related protein
MVDPFSYRSKYTIPKMIFIGTNDPYWTVDATKHYYNEIPGKNLIHYVPNVGHDLGGGKQAFEALSGFFANVAQGKELPLPVWEIKSNKASAELSVKALNQDFVEATLWYTTSSDRDFRNNLWLSDRVKVTDLNDIKIQQEYPKKGYSAFYLDLKYKDPSGGNYSTATRIYVLDKEKVL